MKIKKDLYLLLLTVLLVSFCEAKAQPPLPVPVVKSLKGDITQKVADSDNFPAHEGTEVDSGMSFFVPADGIIEIASGRTIQWFFFGPGEFSVNNIFLSNDESEYINLSSGHLAIAFNSSEADASLLIKTPKGDVEIGSGLFSIILTDNQILKIAVAEGKACLLRENDKKLCTSDKKMLMLPVNTDKPPGIVKISNDILNIWKKTDWMIVGEKPVLKIIQPQEGMHYTEFNIFVVGTTSRGSTVTINNKEIETKPDGSFSGSVALYEGENRLIIQSRSRTGKVTSVSRTVYIDTTPPLLTVSQPPGNFDPTMLGTCDNNYCYIQIFGLTEPGVSLQANGIDVSRFIEDDGSFLIQDFPIKRTERTLTVEAEDMHRQRTIEVLHILEPNDTDFDGTPDIFDSCPLDPSCQ